MPHLVGRDAEIHALQQRLEATRQGQGSLVLISGEAGIGKTSLMQVLARSALSGGAVVALGRCYGDGAPAFGVWRDVLTELAESTGLDPAALPQPFGGAPAVQTAHQLMQSVVNVLQSVTAAGRYSALVLLLDDLHWADRDSLALLDLLTRRLEHSSILTVVTYRTEDVHRHHPLYDLLPSLQRDRPIESIKLHRLGRGDTAVIAESIRGSCTPQMIESLHARSEGIPFFLVELLRDLRERQVLAHAERNPAPGRIPEVLQQILVRRVARLGDAAEQLLQVGAVVGEEWDLGVVEVVLGWPEEQVLHALEVALDAQVIVPTSEGSERYRYSHGLIREVLYAGLVARRCKHLHERIAAVLEEMTPSALDQGSYTAALAHHFCAAEQWEKGLRYSIAAGDAARERYANRSALQFYQQALDILQRFSGVDPREKAALCDRLGQVQVVLNEMEAALSAFEQMVQSARAGNDRVSEGHALLWLSFVQTRLSSIHEARAAGKAAVEVALQADDTRLLAAGYWNLGRLSATSGELELAPHHLNEAERLARQEGDGTLLGRCLMEQARLANWAGDYVRAERQASEGVELARTERDSLFLAGLCWMLGIARGELGQYSRALDALQEGLRHADDADDRHYSVKLLNTIGWVHAEIGDGETALLYDQQALDATRQGPADPVREAECYCLLNLATDRLNEGDLEGAERHLREFDETDRGIEFARFRYLNRNQLTRAQFFLARHDPAEALRWAKDAEDIATAKGMRKNVAKSLMLAGHAFMALNRLPEATDSLGRSVALADELQHGSLRWQTRLRVAQAHLLVRQMPAATEAIEEARALVDHVTVELTDDRLRDIFTRSSLVQEIYAVAAKLQRPPEVPDYPAGLTVREVEVLRLVARGATNKDIALELHISVKTVNAHLNSIFMKVECGTRAAAGAFAFTHGLV